ncbi:lipoate--protein ligase [Clostridiaceae bacterium 14S0207]|nr:lipoate--protein ligase [Clostridiaceae bacterium 14S0207]
MNKIVISKEVNPYYNLALEEELFENVKEDEMILYLWQNEKTIVIGRNQNPYVECDIDAIEKDNISLARRLSGGGTVYHDLGNLNFTFITSKNNENLNKQLKVIKKSLEMFNLSVEFSGRNDLLSDGKKFSGHAFYEENNSYYHHGTLMVDVDITMLQKFLKPSKLKLQSKGIKSVKSRVINLKDKVPNITIDSLIDALKESFKIVYGNVKEESILNKDCYSPRYIDKYSCKKWIYGESPKYTINLEQTLNIGNIQVLLDVESGIINNVKIYSDTLLNINFEDIENKLIHKEFDRNKITKFLKDQLN